MLIFVIFVETLFAAIEVKNETNIPIAEAGSLVGTANVYPEWNMTIEENVTKVIN